MYYFYRDGHNIYCEPCYKHIRNLHESEKYVANKADLPQKYMSAVFPDGIVRCEWCGERFVMYDGRVFMEVVQ